MRIGRLLYIAWSGGSENDQCLVAGEQKLKLSPAELQVLIGTQISFSYGIIVHA